MQLLRRLAQGGVVLLDEVPAHLILGEVTIARGASSARFSMACGGSILLRSVLVGILRREAAIGGHGDGRVER